MQFQRLVSKGPITVDYLAGEGEDLVISFASIGHDATRAPSPEFVATAIGKGTGAFPRKALFVSDATRSWANAPELGPALREAVAQLDHRGKITALGLSMGGFAALAASHMLPMQAVLAFGPQYSISPAIMHQEDRWQDWAARCDTTHLPICPLPPCWGVLCHGLRDDRHQALAFTPTKGIDHILFPERDHADLVPFLKTRGVLAGMMESVVTGDRVRLLRIASSAGGKLRHKSGL